MTHTRPITTTGMHAQTNTYVGHRTHAVSRVGVNFHQHPPRNEVTRKRCHTRAEKELPLHGVCQSSARGPTHLSAVQIHQTLTMLLKDRQRQRLGEQVTRVELGVDVLHAKLAFEAQLANLEVATINMARPMTGLAVT
jgi:hypothetical protein